VTFFAGAIEFADHFALGFVEGLHLTTGQNEHGFVAELAF
jgi:hypothetical protein